MPLFVSFTEGCPAGFAGVSNTWCRPCPAFTYKEHVGWEDCVTCPSHLALKSLYTNPPVALANLSDCPPVSAAM